MTNRNTLRPTPPAKYHLHRTKQRTFVFGCHLRFGILITQSVAYLNLRYERTMRLAWLRSTIDRVVASTALRIWVPIMSIQKERESRWAYERMALCHCRLPNSSASFDIWNAISLYSWRMPRTSCSICSTPRVSSACKSARILSCGTRRTERYLIETKTLIQWTSKEYR